MTFPKWYEKGGVKRLFAEEPKEVGWEPCAGHYDFARGQWIDDEPKKAKKPAKSELEALRAEYQRQKGKKPFMGWSVDKLLEKLAD